MVAIDTYYLFIDNFDRMTIYVPYLARGFSYRVSCLVKSENFCSVCCSCWRRKMYSIHDYLYGLLCSLNPFSLFKNSFVLIRTIKSLDSGHSGYLKTWNQHEMEREIDCNVLMYFFSELMNTITQSLTRLPHLTVGVSLRSPISGNIGVCWLLSSNTLMLTTKGEGSGCFYHDRLWRQCF